MRIDVMRIDVMRIDVMAWTPRRRLQR
jgi:hypothetical protein